MKNLAPATPPRPEQLAAEVVSGSGGSGYAAGWHTTAGLIRCPFVSAVAGLLLLLSWLQNRRLQRLVEQLTHLTKEADYLENAAKSMHLAQHASSSSDKTRLVKLAEGWVYLADKAHEDTRRPRRPTILHPLVQKKMGVPQRGIGFKGFIPAIFGRLVNEVFAERAAGDAEITVTAPPDLVRNPKARPDVREAEVIRDKLLAVSCHKGKFIQRVPKVAAVPRSGVISITLYH
jgi:hypothetical protein